MWADCQQEAVVEFEVKTHSSCWSPLVTLCVVREDVLSLLIEVVALLHRVSISLQSVTKTHFRR